MDMIVALELQGRGVTTKAQMGNVLEFYLRPSKAESDKSGLENVGRRRGQACWTILAPGNRSYWDIREMRSEGS